MTPTPPPPGKREAMSDAERSMRDRARKTWIEKHSVWGTQSGRYPWTDEEFGAPYRGFRSSNGRYIAVYTTGRMFDGRFWVMRYRFVQARGRFELERGTLKHRAKRKDAKAICIQLISETR